MRKKGVCQNEKSILKNLDFDKLKQYLNNDQYKTNKNLVFKLFDDVPIFMKICFDFLG